jgi:hypothetical protein
MLDLVVVDECTAPGGGDHDARVEIGEAINAWRDDRGEVFARARIRPDGYALDWRGVGTLRFSPGSRRVTVRPAAGVSLARIGDVFACVIQPVILQALGHQVLHAGAVRTPAGIVALCGVSGSGKSTLAYAWGRRPGCAQIADDALVLQIAGDAIAACPLPFQARLRAPALQFFDPPEAPSAHPPVESAGPLRAVIMLAQDRADPPRLERVPRHRAFTSILTHAHCFNERDREAVADMTRAYMSLAASVAVFTLRYRPSFEALGRLIDLVDTATRAGAP